MASTAHESGLAQRGLLLLGMMLGIVAVVGYILLRPKDDPPRADNGEQSQSAALAIPNPIASFPANITWGEAFVLSKSLPSSPGWQVRYNATHALALRGSPTIPLDVLGEMLNEEQQLRNFPLKLDDGSVVPNEYAARQTVIIALRAVAEWHKHKGAVQAVGDNPDLQRVYAAIDKLTKNPNEAVRKEAESVKKAVSAR